MVTAALGLRAHSGWAALVAIAGSAQAIRVLDRRRIGLADPAVTGFPQPYHAAEPLPLPEAERLVRSCIDASRRLAERGLDDVIGNLRKAGYKTHGCGILIASGRPLPSFDRILASHALIHTAEGEMFRDALRHAGRHCRLSLSDVREREAYEQAAQALHLSVTTVHNRIAELGAELGPPWREDQKLAVLAAWVALATSVRESMRQDV